MQPRLIDVRVPKAPAGAVVVLHGGAARREARAVSPTQLSVLRMVPIARRVSRLGRGDLAVFRLLNSGRGWRDRPTPADDAAWALDQLGERLGSALPTCLIGHSLGGRAALLTAGRPEVRSVVALAPWVYATDTPDGVTGKRILIVHGSADRIASPDRSAALARSLAGRAHTSYVEVERGKHAMLARRGLFDGLAAQFAAATLLGTTFPGPMEQIMAGEPHLRL